MACKRSSVPTQEAPPTPLGAILWSLLKLPKLEGRGPTRDRLGWGFLPTQRCPCPSPRPTNLKTWRASWPSWSGFGSRRCARAAIPCHPRPMRCSTSWSWGCRMLRPAGWSRSMKRGGGLTHIWVGVPRKSGQSHQGLLRTRIVPHMGRRPRADLHEMVCDSARLRKRAKPCDSRKARKGRKTDALNRVAHEPLQTVHYCDRVATGPEKVRNIIADLPVQVLRKAD